MNDAERLRHIRRLLVAPTHHTDEGSATIRDNLAEVLTLERKLRAANRDGTLTAVVRTLTPLEATFVTLVFGFTAQAIIKSTLETGAAAVGNELDDEPGSLLSG